MHPLVQKLQLIPHPEGGFYKQIYRSTTHIVSPHHGQTRPALTHIYFLLLDGQVSRFHRVLHDEVWNHYAGAPLSLYQFDDQRQLQESRIGGEDNEMASVVPGGFFQAAETTGAYSLVGCSVAPGFDFADFSFIEDPSVQSWITSAHPQLSKFL